MPDREKIINYAEETLSNVLPDEKDTSGIMVKVGWIREVLALLKEQGWNVLTEDADGVIHGLPGDDGRYIMTDGNDIWIDDYVDGVEDGIILDSGKDIREITAWMYMPELPQNGKGR